jgi:microcystin-dependent protein
MAQHDQILDNAPGRAVRLDMNAALAALFSNSSGPVEPAVKVGGQAWFDTTDPAQPKLWFRDTANLAWLDISKDFETASFRESGGDFTIRPENLGDFVTFTTTATANLPAAATVNAKFYFTASASNGAVTLQPMPGETVDGASSKVIPTGFTLEVRATGTGWRTSLIPDQPAMLKAYFNALPVSTPVIGDTVVLVKADGTMARADGSTLGAPVGTIISKASLKVPAGHLPCNGALVSRTTYAALFADIGTTWGAGDGSTTFALPDARGVFLRGFDNGRGQDNGRVFGSYQADLIGSHNHGISDGTHAHGFQGYNAMVRVGGSGGQGTNGGGLGEIGATSYAYSNVSVLAAGGTETRVKNITVFQCIKY